MILIACWNVNSVNSRLTQLEAWVREHQPDIFLLQEIKCISDSFPRTPFEDMGYNLAIHGQKSYNGVAILAKQPIEDVVVSFKGLKDDTQARYVEAVIGQLRIASVYVPNGQEIGSEKFQYKLDFLEGLKSHLRSLLTHEEAVVIGGDFNIAPFLEDVPSSEIFHEERILCSPLERDALREILNLRYVDALRSLHPLRQEFFTWWDYRSGAWDQNRGYRLDHFLLSPQAADLLDSGDVDLVSRSLEKPSDHAPIWIKIRM
jgi:exodeoxyribonuclease-3